jgi:hypothetical protein
MSIVLITQSSQSVTGECELWPAKGFTAEEKRFHQKLRDLTEGCAASRMPLDDGKVHNPRSRCSLPTAIHHILRALQETLYTLAKIQINLDSCSPCL